MYVAGPKYIAHIPRYEAGVYSIAVPYLTSVYIVYKKNMTIVFYLPR